MVNAIILHGKPDKQEYYDPNMPSQSNSHWLPWLQAQLLKHDIIAATPEVPNSYKADWEAWRREVERFEMEPETILVGHSCGGGFWVRYLSEHPDLKVNKVVLVAPWIDPDSDETGDFFEFTIDPDLASRTKGLTIFHSDNDMGNVQKSVAVLRENIKNATYREFHKYGHFCYENMQTDKFPELLEEIIA